MAKIAIKTKAKKVKRKFPVEIKAPGIFKSISLGKSQITDMASLVGKTIKINLMYITKSVKNQNVRLIFSVNEVNAGVAKTEIKSYVQIPYYLNRFLKAGSNLIEDTHTYTSKDHKEIIVKPFIVTRNNVSSMLASAIRSKTRELITSELKVKTADEFIFSITNGRVQLAFRNELKKIFPLKAFEFKRLDIKQKNQNNL